MFLIKRGQVHYIWYTDDLGRKKKISTGCLLKSDALKFLTRFEQNLAERQTRIRRVALSRFIDEFLEYSANAHRRKTRDLYFAALSEFFRVFRLISRATDSGLWFAELISALLSLLTPRIFQNHLLISTPQMS